MDLSGQRYVRLVALHPVEIRPNRHVVYACTCDCGSLIEASSSNLRSGHTRSCGCYNRDATSAANRTHGRSKTRLYGVWRQMMGRCYLSTAPNFKWYGARGIRVARRWHKFENFLADMGERPEGMTLDRVKVDKGYGPSNCRWATRQEQARNTRRNVYVTHNGRTQTISDWEREMGVQGDKFAKRLRRGWPVDRALST